MPEVIASWNAVHSLSTATIIEPVMWETHSRPALGRRPQEILNEQIVENCDLVIGTFWTRLGTPTGEAESGTAEEIEQLRSRGRPVLLYFSAAPVVPDGLDAEQYRALTKYRERLLQQGLCWKYETLAELRELLHRHLAAHMIELLKDHPQLGMPQNHPTMDEAGEQERAARRFSDEYASFLRRLEAEWEAERDSDPISTDDGKYILERAADELLNFTSMIIEDSAGLSENLNRILKELRAIQRHRVYLDGGVSFEEFWKKGDAIIASLHEQLPITKKIAGYAE